MGKEHEQTLLKRRHTSSQQIKNKKKLCIIIIREMQNHKVLSCHTGHNGIIKKSKTIEDGKAVQKRENLYTIGGNVN